MNADGEYTFIDLFAGIGGIRIAFERVGFKCIFSSEIDTHAQKTYVANFGEIPHGDITKINEKDIPPFDLLTAGFPCQPFSDAGLARGFSDIRGTLFFDIIRIAAFHLPEVIFLENVRGLLSHDEGNTFNVMIDKLDEIGYRSFYKVLNAKHFGLPQNRARVYIVAFRDKEIDFEFPDPSNSPAKVADILDNKVHRKYTISDKLWAGHLRRKKENIQYGKGFGYRLFNEDSPYTSTLSARYFKDGSEILIEQKNKNPRKLTPDEARRLQGFPDDFIIPVSDSQAYKQFGNSVAIPVVESIAKSIRYYL